MIFVFFFISDTFNNYATRHTSVNLTLLFITFFTFFTFKGKAVGKIHPSVDNDMGSREKVNGFNYEEFEIENENRDQNISCLPVTF